MEGKHMYVFYQYLNREISKSDLLEFIYLSPELQDELSEEAYFNLLSYSKVKKEIGGSKSSLDNFLFNTCVDRGAYLSYTIVESLSLLIEEPRQFKEAMRKLYEIYEISNPALDEEEFYLYYNEGCTFLEFLAGKYFFTIQDYRWDGILSGEACLDEIEQAYGQAQLAKIALKIREGLLRKKIRIDKEGRYTMDEDLYQELCRNKLYSYENPCITGLDSMIP